MVNTEKFVVHSEDWNGYDRNDRMVLEPRQFHMYMMLAQLNGCQPVRFDIAGVTRLRDKFTEWLDEVDKEMAEYVKRGY